MTDTLTDPAIYTLANAIGSLAESMDHLAASMQALKLATGGPPAQSQPPGSPTGAPSGSPGGDSPQVKRGKKIYAICKQNEWDIPSTGAQITGHPMNANSQKWDDADQILVLNHMKNEWNVG
jgi:hypothetical protein